MLNELFTVISQNKPENPIEFAIKHLETKLPLNAANRSLAEKSKTDFDQGSSLKAQQSETPAILDDGTDLLAKLMSRKKIHSENEAISNANNASGGDLLEKIFKSRPLLETASLNPLAKLSIMVRY